MSEEEEVLDWDVSATRPPAESTRKMVMLTEEKYADLTAQLQTVQGEREHYKAQSETLLTKLEQAEQSLQTLRATAEHVLNECERPGQNAGLTVSHVYLHLKSALTPTPPGGRMFAREEGNG